MAANVLGVAITNESMVPVAKKVATSSMILVGWSLCVGIAVAIATSVTIAKVPDMLKSGCAGQSGNDNTLCSDGLKKNLEYLGSPVTIVFQVACPLIWPCLLMVCVRAGLQGNNKGCLQMACVLQGIGACCSCVSAVGMCVMAAIVGAAASVVSEQACSYGQSGGCNVPPELDNLRSIGGKVTAYVVVGLFLQIVTMCVCGYAAMSANAASTALDIAPFTGSPPRGTELVGAPARS